MPLHHRSYCWWDFTSLPLSRKSRNFISEIWEDHHQDTALTIRIFGPKKWLYELQELKNRRGSRSNPTSINEGLLPSIKDRNRRDFAPIQSERRKGLVSIGGSSGFAFDSCMSDAVLACPLFWTSSPLDHAMHKKESKYDAPTKKRASLNLVVFVVLVASMESVNEWICSVLWLSL